MCSLQSPLIMTVAAAQVVEKGVARVLTNVDGNENPCAAPVLCQAQPLTQPVAPPPWAGTSSLGRTRCRIGHLRDTTSRDGHLQDTSLASQVPNEHWAVGSGCATFYNTCGHEEESAASSTYDICTYLISSLSLFPPPPAQANTIVERDFDKNTFQIFATRDIQEGDELRHVYKSKEWRNCFASLNIIM